MKQFTLLFMLLCFGAVMGQVQKLGALSSGKFLDSAVIMEEDESDVFGYCLLYESDRKSKEVFDLEYVILDKNLNKLTSVNLTQAVFKTWMAKTRAEITFVKKIDNQLVISVNDRLVKVSEIEMKPFFNHRFINVNLNDFSYSREYNYEDFTKKESVHAAGDKMGFDDFWNLQKLIKTKTEYFLAFASPDYNPKAAAISNFLTFDFKRHQSVKKFALLDKDLKVVWERDINSDKKTATKYEYLDSDQDVLLLKKETLIKKAALEAKSIEAYNIKTGQFLGEIEIKDDKYDINLNSISLNNNNIHVFTNTYDPKKGNNLGYGHLVFDKQSLKETKRTFHLWKNLAAAIPGVNEIGVITKGEWLLAQDFVITPKGNLLMVLESYGTQSGVNMLTNTRTTYAMLKDLYLIEFNPDSSIAFTKKIEKRNSVEIPSGRNGLQLREFGVFDYIFCQKIDKTGDFVMYYTLNDQEGNRKKVARKPLWTLGIISNIGGEYGFETLPLYGDDVKIYPGLAKNGYIRLLEVNQKTNQAEMRLEKINL